MCLWEEEKKRYCEMIWSFKSRGGSVVGILVRVRWRWEEKMKMKREDGRIDFFIDVYGDVNFGKLRDCRV